MIYESIKNLKEKAELYFPGIPEMEKFFEAIEANNYEIEKIKPEDFTSLDLRFGEYDTKPADEVLFEAHRIYWDVQIVMEGEEYIEYAPLEEMREEIPYDEDRDIAFYKAEGEKIRAKRGMALLLAPWDGHKPGTDTEKGKSHIKKIVVKYKR